MSRAKSRKGLGDSDTDGELGHEDRERKASRRPGAAGETVLRLNLSPPEDPEDLHLSISVVSGEFATRYLEQIGVKPSNLTMDFVHKSIPLTADCVRATLRAKGHVTDEVLISVPPVKHKFIIPKPISALPFAHLSLNADVDGSTGGGLSSGGAGAPGDLLPSPPRGGNEKASTSAPSSSRMGQGAGALAPADAGPTFRDLASKYLYPFNMEKVARAKVKVKASPDDIRDKGKQSRMQGAVQGERGKQSDSPSMISSPRSYSWGFSGEAPTATAAGSDEFVEGVAAAEEIAEELVQELIVTPQVILMLLAPLEKALVEWHKGQAAETLSRLTLPELRDTISLMSSDSTICFFATCINFLHEEYVKGSSLYQAEVEAKVKRQDVQWKRSKIFSQRLSGVSGRLASIATGGASSMTRPMALQQYDLGYKIFVKERMMEIAKREEERGATGSGAPYRAEMSLVGSRGCLARGSLGDEAPSFKEPPSSSTRVPGVGTGNSRPPSMAIWGYPSEGGDLARQRLSSSLQGVGMEGGEPASLGYSPPPGLMPRPSQLCNGSLSREGSVTGPQRKPGSLPSVSSLTPGPPAPKCIPRIPGLADEPLLSTDYHPVVQRSLKTLHSAHMLTAASMARAILESLGSADLDYLQQMRLFVIQKEFSALNNTQRQDRSGMFFAMPVFLMFLRLSVQILFTNMYTLWSQTKEGIAALRGMDTRLLTLLDPHGYLQRNLSLVQSSPAAGSIAASLPHKSHGAERSHFSDTSALLRSALPDPSSAAARRILHNTTTQKARGVRAAPPAGAISSMMPRPAPEEGRSGGATQRTPPDSLTHLTLSQREALYSDARKLAGTRSHDLRRLGVPVQRNGQTRDSWIEK